MIDLHETMSIKGDMMAITRMITMRGLVIITRVKIQSKT